MSVSEYDNSSRGEVVPESAVQTHPIPAWALSLAIHFVLLIVLVLVVRPAIPKGVQTTTERRGDIVLTKATADAKFEYFDESDADDQPAPQSQATQKSSASDALPLPTAEKSFAPAVALPGLDAPLSQTADLVVSSEGSASSSPVLQLPESQDERAFVAAEAAARRGRGKRGPAAQLSLFGSAPAVGHSFVFVIDRSKSMGGQGLGMLLRAKAELEQALANLQPQHKFQIIAYNEKLVHFGTRTMKNATADNQRNATEFVGSLPALGGTKHEVALLSAVGLKPDVVFLLTDGGPPELTEPEIKSLLRYAGGATFHCIRFDFGPDQQPKNFMRRLSQATGGSFHYVDVNKRE